MTSASRRFLAVSLLGFALLALETTSLCGASNGLQPGFPYANRTDAFRRLLFEMRFQPLQSFAELQERPSESLFLMLGEPSCLSRGYFPEGIRSFVEKGGAVLIATDKKTGGEVGEELQKLAGVTVTGETLVVRRRLFLQQNNQHILYNDSEYCPFVEPHPDDNALSGAAAFLFGRGRPSLFRSDSHSSLPGMQVATNAPSRLATSGWFLLRGIHRLAKLPSFCQDEKMGLDPRLGIGSEAYRKSLADEREPLFAVGGTVGKGRVLVLADHSVFINRMILPHDNGNLEFAANCLNWLRGGSSRLLDSHQAADRNKVLFWDDGRVQKDFEVPLKKVPLTMPPVLPPESAIVAAVDENIAKLEAGDAFNRALLDRIDASPGGFPRVVRNTMYLLTLAMALFLAYRFLWRSRHQSHYAAPSLAKALRNHEPKTSLLDQRRRALLRLGNFWEMGQRLARECFESAGVPLTADAMPRVRAMQGSRWQRWRTQRRITRLWRLARGDSRNPLSPAALQRLRREVEELQTALAKGTIELTRTDERASNELATDQHR